MTFTARPRTEWAEIRENLEKDPINKRTLELIDNAYVLVALETEAPPITVNSAITDPLSISLIIGFNRKS